MFLVVKLQPFGSERVNAGAENRAWYQTYAHALDIAAFIPSVTIRLMANDVFTEDDLLGRRDLSWAGKLQHHKRRPVPQTKRWSLTFR